LAELNKKQTDISLQIEEIYDLVKEQDNQALVERAEAEKTRADQLVLAAIGLSDLLDDFCAYARQSGSEELHHQAGLLRESANGILSAQGIFSFGAAGQSMDPRIHTVKASVESPLPRELVVDVLQSGYVYRNVILRKAAVVVSRGTEDAAAEAPSAEMEDLHPDTGDWDDDRTAYQDDGEDEGAETEDLRPDTGDWDDDRTAYQDGGEDEGAETEDQRLNAGGWDDDRTAYQDDGEDEGTETEDLRLNAGDWDDDRTAYQDGGEDESAETEDQRLNAERWGNDRTAYQDGGEDEGAETEDLRLNAGDWGDDRTAYQDDGEDECAETEDLRPDTERWDEGRTAHQDIAEDEGAEIRDRDAQEDNLQNQNEGGWNK
jgi:molecular chaperone GrpE (heat shock protein)